MKYLTLLIIIGGCGMRECSTENYEKNIRQILSDHQVDKSEFEMQELTRALGNYTQSQACQGKDQVNEN